MLFPCLGGDFDMLLYGKFANLGGGLIMMVCCHVHHDCGITIVIQKLLREILMAPR
jgi:chloramphenicol O-acetyltransferase